MTGLHVTDAGRHIQVEDGHAAGMKDLLGGSWVLIIVSRGYKSPNMGYNYKWVPLRVL